jgi:SAM-dependent methyltransferase
MHDNCRAIFAKYVCPLLRDGTHVLELSPDADKTLLNAAIKYGHTLHYDTADLGGTGTVAMLDENVIDCLNDTFDAVWASSVVEHVREPWLWTRELARVTRPGGIVVLIGPFTWRLHRVDCGGVKRDAWRVLPDGMHVLFREAGLICEHADLYSLSVGTPGECRKNRGQPIDVLGIGRKPL